MNLNDRMHHILCKYGEYLLYIFIAAVLSTTCSQTATAQCRGSYQVALAKDSTITVPCKNMVLMNLGTFTSYYQARQNYELLKIKIPEYRAVNDSIRASLTANIDDLNRIIDMEQTSKEQAMHTVLKLDKENRKLQARLKVTKWLAIGGIGFVSYEGIKALLLK